MLCMETKEISGEIATIETLVVGGDTVHVFTVRTPAPNLAQSAKPFAAVFIARGVRNGEITALALKMCEVQEGSNVKVSVRTSSDVRAGKTDYANQLDVTDIVLDEGFSRRRM